MELYDEIALATLVIFSFLYLIKRVDPIYLVAIALILLLVSGIEFASGNSSAANDLAILFFYFLSIGVIFMIVDDYIQQRPDSLYFSVRNRLEHLHLPRSFRRLLPYLPYISFVALSLLILSDLLLPGYVLITDMVFGPIFPVTSLYSLSPVLGGGNALTAFEVMLSYILPGWAIEKLFLFLIFFLSASSMYVLTGKAGGPSRYYASLLYTLNPFIYVRILAGAWGLAFAYALLPLAFYFFLRLFSPARKRYRIPAVASMLYSLVAVFDIHMFVLLVGLSLLYTIIRAIYLAFYSSLNEFRLYYIPLINFVLFTLLLNIYWIYSSGIAVHQILGSFNLLDAIAFASRPTIYGNTMLSIIAMYGFFRTGYIYPIDLMQWLIVFLPLFLFLSFYGFLSGFREKTRGPVATTLLISMVLSVIFATGISSPLTSSIYIFLYKHLPLFDGFREPQKFVALLVLSYSYLGYLGILELEKHLKRLAFPVGSKQCALVIFISAVLIVSLISPLLYSYTELNGFSGQLSNVEYPHSWYVARNIMMKNITDNSALFLPWHTYMYYNWTGTVFASPFASFFKMNIISGGQDVYVGGQGANTTFASALMLQILSERNDIHDLGNILSLLDVKYIFLSKSADFTHYNFLYSQRDLRLILNSSSAALFLNLHPVYRSFTVTGVRYFTSLASLVNVSNSVNMLDYAWIYGKGMNSSNSSLIPVASSEINPVDYSLSMPGLIGLNVNYYLVFIPPAGANSQWALSRGIEVSGSYQFSPYLVYQVSGGPAHLSAKCTTYTEAIAAYAASSISLAAILFLVFYENYGKRRK